VGEAGENSEECEKQPKKYFGGKTLKTQNSKNSFFSAPHSRSTDIPSISSWEKNPRTSSFARIIKMCIGRCSADFEVKKAIIPLCWIGVMQLCHLFRPESPRTISLPLRKRGDVLSMFISPPIHTLPCFFLYEECSYMHLKWGCIRK
jgi:hypothetical protein